MNVPRLPTRVPEQVALYLGNHLITQDVGAFDPAVAVARLRGPSEVIAVDIGGDKIRKATYTLGQGQLAKHDEEVFQSRGGAGYLPFLERVAAEARASDVTVGISSATKMDGSVITRTVNLPTFLNEMRAAYDANYENLFPGNSFVANDTVTGVCGASTRLAVAGAEVSSVAFFICASGVGASVVSNGMATHVEAAHVPLVDELNPLRQATPCDVEGRGFVCVERVTAIRAGIEDLYRQQTGVALDGVALGAMFQRRDPLPTLLFETSARVLAHAIIGVLTRYDMTGDGASTVILHGGGFEVERYRDQILHDIGAILPAPLPRVLFSRDISGNVCLDGAAVLAAYHV